MCNESQNYISPSLWSHSEVIVISPDTDTTSHLSLSVSAPVSGALLRQFSFSSDSLGTDTGDIAQSAQLLWPCTWVGPWVRSVWCQQCAVTITWSQAVGRPCYLALIRSCYLLLEHLVVINCFHIVWPWVDTRNLRYNITHKCSSLIALNIISYILHDITRSCFRVNNQVQWQAV